MRRREKEERKMERLGGARLLKKEEIEGEMWVWNDTKAKYQKVKPASIQDGCRILTDSQNNIIEKDDLYRFMC